MFFISWGSRGKLAEVGPAGHRHCAYCDKDSYFTRMVGYTVRHIYWIFRWVTDRTPYLICGNCGAAHGDDEEQINSKEVTKAISAWDRRGWLAGLGGIGAIIATGSIAAAANHASDQTYVAAPRVGDIYEADLAKMIDKPEASQMYSTIRVVGVTGDKVEVEVANLYYNDWRGVDRDISEGKASAESYYAPEHVAFSHTSIEKMFADGVIHDVRR